MIQKQPVPLPSIEQDAQCVVAVLAGGLGFQKRLRSMGVREGKKLRIVAKHPFAGPLVVEVDGRKITIGRGMASKIAVEPEA